MGFNLSDSVLFLYPSILSLAVCNFTMGDVVSHPHLARTRTGIDLEPTQPRLNSSHQMWHLQLPSTASQFMKQQGGGPRMVWRQKQRENMETVFLGKKSGKTQRSRNDKQPIGANTCFESAKRLKKPFAASCTVKKKRCSDCQQLASMASTFLLRPLFHVLTVEESFIYAQGFTRVNWFWFAVASGMSETQTALGTLACKSIWEAPSSLERFKSWSWDAW